MLVFRNKLSLSLLTLSILSMLMTACGKPDRTQVDEFVTERDVASTRIPGEWELQASVWLQWPTKWEKELRPVIIDIIEIASQYQTVNLIVPNQRTEDNLLKVFEKTDAFPENIFYHHAVTDNSWLRDNGPVYVEDKNGLWLQDFGFDAWGGNFGKEVEYAADDRIPEFIAGAIPHAVYEDFNDYILERGNLEANGQGIVMLNWDCQYDRNPHWSRENTEKLFARLFGAHTVLWAEGYDPEDGTTGHIDGTARFVDENTVVILEILNPDDEAYPGEAEGYDKLAADAEAAGLEVIRFPMPGYVKMKEELLPAIYMNYFVGNGFVIGMAFGNEEWDDDAQHRLQELYPDRDIHMMEANALWLAGGGIHCVTNDEPSI